MTNRGRWFGYIFLAIGVLLSSCKEPQKQAEKPPQQESSPTTEPFPTPTRTPSHGLPVDLPKPIADQNLLIQGKVPRAEFQETFVDLNAQSATSVIISDLNRDDQMDLAVLEDRPGAIHEFFGAGDQHFLEQVIDIPLSAQAGNASAVAGGLLQLLDQSRNSQEFVFALPGRSVLSYARTYTENGVVYDTEVPNLWSGGVVEDFLIGYVGSVLIADKAKNRVLSSSERTISTSAKVVLSVPSPRSLSVMTLLGDEYPLPYHASQGLLWGGPADTVSSSKTLLIAEKNRLSFFKNKPGNNSLSTTTEPLEPISEISLEFEPGKPAAADLNGDHVMDLVVPHETEPRMDIFWGKGDGTFNRGPSIDIGATKIRGVKCADFNGDGLRDLVVLSEGQKKLDLVYGLGGETFSSAEPYVFPGTITSIDVADIDFGGGPDIAVTLLSEQGQARLGLLYSVTGRAVGESGELKTGIPDETFRPFRSGLREPASFVQNGSVDVADNGFYQVAIKKPHTCLFQVSDGQFHPTNEQVECGDFLQMPLGNDGNALAFYDQVTRRNWVLVRKSNGAFGYLIAEAATAHFYDTYLGRPSGTVLKEPKNESEVVEVLQFPTKLACLDLEGGAFILPKDGSYHLVEALTKDLNWISVRTPSGKRGFILASEVIRTKIPSESNRPLYRTTMEAPLYANPGEDRDIRPLAVLPAQVEVRILQAFVKPHSPSAKLEEETWFKVVTDQGYAGFVRGGALSLSRTVEYTVDGRAAVERLGPVMWVRTEKEPAIFVDSLVEPDKWSTQFVFTSGLPALKAVLITQGFYEASQELLVSLENGTTKTLEELGVNFGNFSDGSPNGSSVVVYSSRFPEGGFVPHLSLITRGKEGFEVEELELPETFASKLSEIGHDSFKVEWLNDDLFQIPGFKTADGIPAFHRIDSGWRFVFLSVPVYLR